MDKLIQSWIKGLMKSDEGGRATLADLSFASPVVACASAASSGDDDVQELREPEAAARGIGAWERLYVEATKEGPPATKQQGPPEEVPIMVVDFGDADSEDALAKTKPTPKAGAAQAPFLPREETFSPLGKKAG